MFWITVLRSSQLLTMCRNKNGFEQLVALRAYQVTYSVISRHGNLGHPHNAYRYLRELLFIFCLGTAWSTAALSE